MICKFGILLLATYVCRTSALPPCVCTRDYKPVCGSDGRTYANMCLFNCARFSNNDLTMQRSGPCEHALTSCICTYNYKPVCGSDGTTYPNECSLNCQRARNPVLEPRYDGPCRSERLKTAESPCTCTRDMRLVCGTDGVTYSNLCLLKCNAQVKTDLSVKHAGPCGDEVNVLTQAVPSSCSCTRNLEPVCGNDGVTYNNLCLLDCAAQSKPLALKNVGPCEDSDSFDTVKMVEQPQPPKSCVCARNYMPVCGSDGKTYSNYCMLGCSSKDNPNLRFFSAGACDEDLKVDVVEQPVY